jgi:hypothetical protein
VSARAQGWVIPEPVLRRIQSRLGARRQLALPIVLVVLRQHHHRRRTPEQIAGWMAAAFGPDNATADEGFIRFVLATIPQAHGGSDSSGEVGSGEGWRGAAAATGLPSKSPTTQTPWQGHEQRKDTDRR